MIIINLYLPDQFYEEKNSICWLLLVSTMQITTIVSINLFLSIGFIKGFIFISIPYYKQTF